MSTVQVRFINWITIKESSYFGKTYILGKSKDVHNNIYWFKFLLPRHYVVFESDMGNYKNKYQHIIKLGKFRILDNLKKQYIDSFENYQKPFEEENLVVLLNDTFTKIDSITNGCFNDLHWFFNLNKIHPTDSFEVDLSHPDMNRLTLEYDTPKFNVFEIRHYRNPLTNPIPEIDINLTLFSFDLECWTVGEFDPGRNPITHCSVNIKNNNKDRSFCLIAIERIPDFSVDNLLSNECYYETQEEFNKKFRKNKLRYFYGSEENLLLIIKRFLENQLDVVLTYNGNEMDLKYINRRLDVHGHNQIHMQTPDEQKSIPLLFKKNRSSSLLNTMRTDIESKNGTIFFDLHNFVKKEEIGLDSYSLEELSKKNFNCWGELTECKLVIKDITKKKYEDDQIDYSNVEDPDLIDETEIDAWKFTISKAKNKTFDLVKQVINTANYLTVDNEVEKIIMKQISDNVMELYIRPLGNINSYIKDNKLTYIQFGKDDINIVEEYENFSLEKSRNMAAYCIHDATLCTRLWESYNIPFKINASSYFFWLPQENILFWYATTTCKGPILNFFLEHKLMYLVREKPEKKPYEGAIVFDPVGRIIPDPILILDYGSLYPNCCIFGNLSPETHILKIKITDSAKKTWCLNRLKEIYPYPDYLVIETPNTSYEKFVCELDVFLKKEKGIIPSLLESLIAKRKLYKNQLKQAKTETERRLYDNLQLVTKLMANSIYGLMGTKEFNLSAIDCAKACTTIGRNMLKYVDGTVTQCVVKEDGIYLPPGNKQIWLGKELDTFYPSEKPLVPCNLQRVYGDTDSIFIRLVGLNIENEEDLISQSVEIGKFIEKTINSHILFLNFTMEFEYVLLNTFMLSKKKYYGEKYVPGYKKGDLAIIAGKGYKKRDMCEYYQTISKEFDLLIKREIKKGTEEEEIKKILANELRIEFKDLIKNKSKKISNQKFFLTRKYSEVSKNGENPNAKIVKEWNLKNKLNQISPGERYYYTFVCPIDQEWTKKIKAKRNYEFILANSKDEIPADCRIYYEILLERVANRVLGVFGDKVFTKNFLKQYF